MSLYPESPAPEFSAIFKARWKTIISPFDNGKEVRKQKQFFAQYDMSFLYNLLTPAEFQTLWNFYQARKGAYESFYAYAVDSADYDALYVATADGVLSTFDIPGKSTSAQSIYINGVLQSGVSPVAYTVLVGGGQEDSDRVQFVSTPTIGSVITCDFTGYLRNRCRFRVDEITRELFSVAIYKTGLELKGLSFSV